MIKRKKCVWFQSAQDFSQLQVCLDCWIIQLRYVISVFLNIRQTCFCASFIRLKFLERIIFIFGLLETPTHLFFNEKHYSMIICKFHILVEQSLMKHNFWFQHLFITIYENIAQTPGSKSKNFSHLMHRIFLSEICENKKLVR